MNNNTLYIDADVPLYRACFSAEEETDWGNDLWTLHSNMARAKEVFTQEIKGIQDEFPTGTPITLCFSGVENFRKDLLESYKSNRKKVRKPMLLTPLKQWVLGQYSCCITEGLEADDLLGLNSDKGIMVSVDKDLRTVPGRHFNPDKPEEGTVTVSKEEAHYNHMYQTLCGDSTDGYKGCPTVGPVGAKKLLDCPPEAMWKAVVEAFDKKGIPEEEALVQAHLARILRGMEWDYEAGKPRLWVPS